MRLTMSLAGTAVVVTMLMSSAAPIALAQTANDPLTLTPAPRPEQQTGQGQEPPRTQRTQQAPQAQQPPRTPPQTQPRQTQQPQPARQPQNRQPAPLSEAASQPWIQRIVVTAQKREQNQNVVPIAITVLSGEELKRSGVQEFYEATQYTPGLQFFKSSGIRSSYVSIRGIGTSSFNDALEPSVGIFIDGVYMNRQGMGVDDLIDVERVEVLRGPQGTLFGRNTPAGAISVVTKRPTDQYEAEGELTYGNLNTVIVRGTVSGPVAPGVKGRLTGFFNRRDGDIENVFNGDEINDRHRWGLRGKLEFDPNPNLNVLVTADFNRANETCCVPIDVIRSGPRTQFFEILGEGPLPSLDPDDREVSINDELENSATEYGITIEANLKVPGHTITSITGYRGWDAEERFDTDYASFSAFPLSKYETKVQQFSQEIRIANDDTSKFSYVAGLYYFFLDIESDVEIPFGPQANAVLSADNVLVPTLTAFGVSESAFPDLIEGVALGDLTINQVFADAGVPVSLGPTGDTIATGNGFTLAQLILLDPDLTPAEQTALIAELDPTSSEPILPNGGGVLVDNNNGQTQSFAFFADGTYNVTDQLAVTGGVRLTHERKKGEGRAVIDDPLNVFFPASPAYDVDFDDTQVTGRTSVQYFWMDDVMTFATFSTGYKSGSINLQRLAFGTEREVDAERSRNIEVGVKSLLYGGRLSVNATAYRTVFNDFQANPFDGVQFNLVNAGKVKTRGVEAEAVFTPTRELILSGGIEFNQADYVEFDEGPVSAAQQAELQSSPSRDLADRALANAPNWRGHFVATYTKELGNGLNGYVRGEYAFTGATRTQDALDPRTEQEAYSLVNGRVGVINDGGKWEVSAWGKNLLDESYSYAIFDTPGSPGSFSSYLAPPRTYGVTLRIRN